VKKIADEYETWQNEHVKTGERAPYDEQITERRLLLHVLRCVFPEEVKAID
jgi:hypothetical protein